MPIFGLQTALVLDIHPIFAPRKIADAVSIRLPQEGT